MPPVSHLYFLGFFFGCVTVFQETEGEFTVLVSDFLFRNSNDRAGDGFSQVRTQTACKYFNKMIWEKKNVYVQCFALENTLNSWK